MKKFLPYFKLIAPVKGRFLLAIVAGIIYGAASGFGLPFMAAKVFPLLFSSGEQGLVIAVQAREGKEDYFDLGAQKTFELGDKLFREEEGSFESLPQGSELDSTGVVALPSGDKLALDELSFFSEGAYVGLNSKLFIKTGKSEYQPIAEGKPAKPDAWTVFWSVMMLPMVFLVRGFFGFINTYQITYCGNFVLERLRSQVFEKLQRLDLAFFQRNGSGDLMTRLMSETAKLQQMLTASSNDLIKQPITFIGAIIALIWISIQEKEMVFILVCLGIIPVVVFPIRKLSKKMLKRMRQGAIGEGELGNCVQENLMAARDVRAFNLEEREIGKFRSILARFFKLIMKVTKYRAMIGPTVEFVTAVGISIAIYFAAQSGLTLEKVIPLIFALYMSYDPIKRMGKLQSQLVLGAVAIERLEAILHTEESVKDPTSPKELPALKGAISFENVLFEYEEGKAALDHVTAKIVPGEVVALVGPSGAGKSTFTHLISRTYEFQEGQITFDGHDVRDHRLKDIRKNVSVVSQDPYLFNDTVENNIRLGKLDATDEEIREAARLAHCSDFIEELPEGYQTIVGEKATRLSGGQRQRLAIARAFLKDSPILILDEATSALDAESEQAVQGALEKLVKGRTTLIIAHRFSSIQIATRILVFDKGAIAGDGTHEELMESLPLYQELYRKQMLS